MPDLFTRIEQSRAGAWIVRFLFVAYFALLLAILVVFIYQETREPRLVQELNGGLRMSCAADCAAR